MTKKRKRTTALAAQAKKGTAIQGGLVETGYSIHEKITRQNEMMEELRVGNATILDKLDEVTDRENAIQDLIADGRMGETVSLESRKFSTRERMEIRREVCQRIGDLLGFVYEDGILTDESVEIREKYYPMFVSWLYIDLKDKCILANRVDDTPSVNFNMAIQKIQEWEPEKGISELKNKADQQRRMRLRVELGDEKAAKQGQYYLMKRKQRIKDAIRARDLVEMGIEGTS